MLKQTSSVLAGAFGAFVASGMLLGASAAQATVVIETFDNYTTGGNVAAWANFNNTFVVGANDWTINVTDGGYGFHFDDTGNTPNGIDISGNPILEIDFAVNSGGEFGTTVIVVLEDKNGLQSVYDLGVLLGNFPAGFDGTANVPLTLPGGFDTTGLNFFHVQGNSFATVYPTPYSITFKELRVTPEPATLGLVGCGLGLVALRRRRA
jgi:hypothetical protein